MSGWSFDYQDSMGPGTAPVSTSKEAAIELAAARYRQGARIIRIYGPNGEGVPLDEFEAWKKANPNRW